MFWTLEISFTTGFTVVLVVVVVVAAAAVAVSVAVAVAAVVFCLSTYFLSATTKLILMEYDIPKRV
jgi:hypothetical protein